MGESYRDLFVWRESVEVAASIVTLTDEFPKPKCFALIDQMQRSAISVPSNIAEGKGRLTTRELRHFVCIARGSLFELQTQLEIARKLNLIEPHAYAMLLPRMQKIGVGINNWLRKLNLAILNTSKPKHLNT